MTILLSGLLTVIVFFAILAVLILVHEAGHFVVAKLSHITVKEFGLGFGPKVFSVTRGETVYRLNAIPIGGYVKMTGEEDPTLPGALAGKPRGIRALVLSAGALMNIILPIILLTASFMIPHQTLKQTVLIKEVAAESPAEKAGIQAGDVIVSVNGKRVENPSDVAYRIALGQSSDIRFALSGADSKVREVTVRPRWNPPEGQGPTGIRTEGKDGVIRSESLPIWQALPQGTVAAWETLVLFKNEMEKLIIRQTAPQLAGPIGIAQITGEVARAGISPVFRFAALLSLNLAVVNLLPLPALDGGRLAFVALEWVRRGKRISPQKEGLVHLIGLIALLTLMAVISYLDITRIISHQSLIP